MDATHVTPGSPTPEAQPVTTCYRHPSRESYIRCTRCERFICPACMLDAPIGHQCPECVKEGHRSIRQARTVFGGRLIGTPFLTYFLIVVNVLVYVLELVRPGIVDRFDSLGHGVTGPDGLRYVVEGDLLPPGFHEAGIAHGEWYRLITSGFLHLPATQGQFGILHILLNMYSLWLFGQVVEQQLGRVRMLALYLVGLLGGSVLGYLIAPEEAAVGASGAIFGLVATYFLMSRKMHHDPLGGGRQLVGAVVWLVASAGFTFWQGHLGGLLAGFAAGSVMVFAPRKGRVLVQTAGVLAVLGLLTAMVFVQTADLAGRSLWG
ncbi:rhomboid family intramembrane serine protease [Kitasatospora indigofera]|uniref:rhomboid family intramembrane serine protease n=1 Tax=Kitasatospora indigofera TaxID=67307 RepID=UPI0036A3DE4F